MLPSAPRPEVRLAALMRERPVILAYPTSPRAISPTIASISHLAAIGNLVVPSSFVRAFPKANLRSCGCRFCCLHAGERHRIGSVCRPVLHLAREAIVKGPERESRQFLTDLFAGPFPGHAIIMQPEWVPLAAGLTTPTPPPTLDNPPPNC